jgi:uncharacterized protein involved in exopolysaccharide biosynthesis
MTMEQQALATSPVADDEEFGFGEVIAHLRKRRKLLTAAPLVVGVATAAITFLIPPTFTARSVFMPPQQQQSVAASAIASLGALSGLAGGLAGLRTPADQYVALMESVTVADRMVDRFGLMREYDAKFRVDARTELAKRTHVSVGKKDGLITVEVDDHSPQRAADMANRYIDELRSMTNTIAVSEAQQRRKFFDQQMQQTKQRLVAAQLALQSSGLSDATIKADPRAAAEAFASLRAQVTAAEVKLQAMRGALAEGAPEVQQQKDLLASLQHQLALVQQPDVTSNGPDYVGKYREFKYQEALFEIYAKEYELARADESREGALIQVVDPATPPERRSKPKRLTITLTSTLLTALILSAWAVWTGSREGRRPTA